MINKLVTETHVSHARIEKAVSHVKIGNAIIEDVLQGANRLINLSTANATKFVQTQFRPLPALPSISASGKSIPLQCFNPFNSSAPCGFWERCRNDASACVASLLGLETPRPFLFIHYLDLKENIDIDTELERRGYVGFCIHTERDVLLFGLSKNAAKLAFEKIANERNASNVIMDAPAMIPLIANKAKNGSKIFKIEDDYTTPFGYSLNQLGPLKSKKRHSENRIQSSIACGGPAQQAFVKQTDIDANVINIRAELRLRMVALAEKVSSDFVSWTNNNRPRVTLNTQQDNEFVRCPFTHSASIPPKTKQNWVQLSTWESCLRGIEEHLMVSFGGMLPNVIWATILARVLERTEIAFGDFDAQSFRTWNKSNRTASIPTRLGFPAKGCVSRILPKGAAGISPSKPMHDDNNGVISLGCWTNLTESNAPVDLVFLVNGHEVLIRVTHLRWLLFMGYLPHETRSTNKNNPATEARLHHSSFVKPEVEYLATHVLSNLPCEVDGDDWSMEFVDSMTGLRDDIKLIPIASKD